MDRSARIALPTLLAALAGLGLVGCGDDEVAIASQGSTLTQLADSTTTAAPTTEPPPETTVEATTTTVYVAPVPGCLDYLNFQIEAGQEETIALWEGELDQSRDALQAYCVELADSDPERVQEMIEEKRTIDAFLAEVAANEAAATTEG